MQVGEHDLWASASKTAVIRSFKAKEKTFILSSAVCWPGLTAQQQDWQNAGYYLQGQTGCGSQRVTIAAQKWKLHSYFFVLNISFLRQIQRQIHLRVDLTADFAVDHDVQVFLRVSTDVSGNSMEADGGILQKETQPWTIKPWQTPTRNKACTLLFCDYHHGWTNLRFSVYILTQGICFSLQIRYHTLEKKCFCPFIKTIIIKIVI